MVNRTGVATTLATDDLQTIWTAMNPASTFEPWLSRWQLEPDGAVIVTPSARLLPVIRSGGPAMLKIASDRSERAASLLLRWWDGGGAARVLANEGDALLLERATGQRSLTMMATESEDDAATVVLCDVLEQLHRPRRRPTPTLDWLDEWFGDLWPGQADADGWIRKAARIARELLDDPRESVTLHGDIHHGNVLDFDTRGWLAIDPKHLWGERGFDYAPLFANPDKANPALFIGRSRERFRRRVDLVTEHAGIERDRLLCWIMAWSGLSATWIAADHGNVAIDKALFELAAEALITQ